MWIVRSRYLHYHRDSMYICCWCHRLLLTSPIIILRTAHPPQLPAPQYDEDVDDPAVTEVHAPGSIEEEVALMGEMKLSDD